MIPLDHRDRGNRADPYTEPNSSFSDSSDSLNSLNSMKVPLHLEKTPMISMANETFDRFHGELLLVDHHTKGGEHM